MPENFNIEPDFSGWATKYNIKCKDGRTIVPGAFAHCDGAVVPMVYMHNHKSIDQVLGNARLSHRTEGVWADCWVNDTDGGRKAKELVQHGDITSFSIFADELQESFGKAVSHGTIKELSLVLAGANKGATIENVIRHDDVTGDVYTDETAAVFSLENGEISLAHGDTKPKTENSDDETVEDILNSMTEKQREVTEGLVGAAIEATEKKYENMKHDGFNEGGNNMSTNLLEGDGIVTNTNVMSHADMEAIFADIKRYGSLKESVIQHGFQPPKYIAHSVDNIDILYPDATPVTKTPGWVSRPMGWVSKVLTGVKHSPFSKIKSVFADITEDDARAKGYIKGKQKKEEVFSLLKRITEAQMVYKKQGIDRDDWIDIVSFDIAIWIKSEMRLMLDEELARAFLIGDGRSASSDDKIDELHIRPIAFDDDFYAIKTVVPIGTTATETERAKGFVKSVIRTRKKYRGSGSPTLFITDDLLADMLLAEDGNGRPLYENEEKIKGVLRVSQIVTVPVMEGLKTKDGKNTIEAIIVNLNDYTSGADKGGAVSLFDDFDIDYNRMKYLIETKCSGALTVPYSAMVFHFPIATVSPITPPDNNDDGEES